MNTQIIITPAGLLWVAGAIVSISAAAGVLIRIYKHFRKPGETQDHRIAELERKSVNDYNRLNDLDNGMQRLEEGNKITQRALLALLAHGIDGNDVEVMKKAKTDLTNHLIEQIRQNTPQKRTECPLTVLLFKEV